MQYTLSMSSLILVLVQKPIILATKGRSISSTHCSINSHNISVLESHIAEFESSKVWFVNHIKPNRPIFSGSNQRFLWTVWSLSSDNFCFVYGKRDPNNLNKYLYISGKNGKLVLTTGDIPTKCISFNDSRIFQYVRRQDTGGYHFMNVANGLFVGENLRDNFSLKLVNPPKPLVQLEF